MQEDSSHHLWFPLNNTHNWAHHSEDLHFYDTRDKFDQIPGQKMTQVSKWRKTPLTKCFASILMLQVTHFWRINQRILIYYSFNFETSIGLRHLLSCVPLKCVTFCKSIYTNMDGSINFHYSFQSGSTLNTILNVCTVNTPSVMCVADRDASVRSQGVSLHKNIKSSCQIERISLIHRVQRLIGPICLPSSD